MNERKISSKFIESVLKVSPSVAVPLAQGEHDIQYTEISTDSRKVSPGAVFLALRGERFDGHAFIEQAINAGAKAFIVEKDAEKKFAGRSDVVFYPVADTTEALRHLGAVWRRKFSIPVVAVAGSTGKTTTKELTASLLSGHFKNVLKTERSENGFIGIPLTLLKLRSHHDCAVIEIGIDDSDAMKKHIDLVRPTSSLITLIGPEHLERLGTVENVAKEESIAITAVAEAGGKVAINLDDPWISKLKEKVSPSLSVYYKMGSLSEANDKAMIGEYDERQGVLRVKGLGVQAIDLKLPLPGLHNAKNLLAATCLAALLGLRGSEIQDGLKTFKPAEGRSEVQSYNGILFVCDYYNANPTSMNAGLELLGAKAKDKKGRKWVCLADMLELGSGEESFHRQLALPIIDQGIDEVLLFGNRMQWLLDELKRKNFSGSVHHFTSHQELAEYLKQNAEAGDFVLIKGSRSQRMEEVLKQFNEKI